MALSVGEPDPLKPEELLEAAQAEAAEILERANAEAGESLQAARRRGEEVEAAGYQAGFEQGEKAGQQLGEQKTEPLLNHLKTILEQIPDQHEELFRSREEQLVHIAYLVGLQVLHRELKQDESVVLDVVRAAMQKVRQATRVTVYVSPRDFQFLESHMESLKSLTGENETISLEPDEEMARGGCRIISNTGEVDATVNSMIENLRERLWESE
jgi:flagellar assembly protein FliH